MVTFIDLRDAKPDLWRLAADDLARLAKEAEQAVSDVYDRGKGALDQYWTDVVGQRAAEKLKQLTDAFETTAITVRGAVSVLDGLSEAAALAQRSLQAAVDFATRSGVEVDHSGVARVSAINKGSLAAMCSLFDGDGWGHGAQTGWDWFDKHDHSHTQSWAEANAQRDFFLHHGGSQVPLAQAQPGDLVYFEQRGTGGPVPADPGTVHHAAIVTSVTPDGDIHYTQHSDARLNVSLNGRLPA